MFDNRSFAPNLLFPPRRREGEAAMHRGNPDCPASRFVGRHTSAPVPRYFLYGDTEATDEWFVNVEPLDQRCREIGWVIAPHAHPRFVQIVLVERGAGVMTAEAEERSFQGPALLVVPAHSIHGFRYAEETSGWVLTVANEYLAALAERAPDLSCIWSAPSATLCDESEFLPATLTALTALDRELDSGAPGGVIAAEAQLMTLLVLFLRQLARSQELVRAEVPGGPAGLVSRFQELIEDHYAERWNIGSYAGALGVSVAQLRAACLGVASQPPLKLVHERVLIEAKRNLIYSAHSIAQIAYGVGFDDPAYFSRFFAREVGETPAQFRASKAFAQVSR